jgi:hypothetical protein
MPWGPRSHQLIEIEQIPFIGEQIAIARLLLNHNRSYKNKYMVPRLSIIYFSETRMRSSSSSYSDFTTKVLTELPTFVFLHNSRIRCLINVAGVPLPTDNS